jgi:hypothetical protein
MLAELGMRLYESVPEDITFEHFVGWWSWAVDMRADLALLLKLAHFYKASLLFKLEIRHNSSNDILFFHNLHGKRSKSAQKVQLLKVFRQN